FRSLFRDEGVSVTPEVFDAAFYAADDALVGKVPPGFFLEGTVDALARGVEANLGVNEAAVAANVAARFLADVRDHLSKNLPVLASLSRRYRLGIVSNFYGNLEAVCEAAGIAKHVTAIVDSEVLGFMKPDARIFLAALRALETPPTAAVFVGD